MKILYPYLRMLILASAVVLTYLVLTHTEYLSAVEKAQLSDICKQRWPDTLDSALARRRACGPIRSAGVD